MNMFNTLCLEISSYCNRRCPFCPVKYSPRPKELMDWSLIEKVSNELGAVNYRGRIELYIYNEPLMEMERLSLVVRHLRTRIPQCCLMIATNGDYLDNPQQMIRLYKEGLNQVLVNCYTKKSYEYHQELFTRLPSTIDQQGSLYGRVSPKKQIARILDKSDPSRFGKGVFNLTNRAGNVSSFIPKVSSPLSRMCVKPFRLLNINWKGDALVCCQDYFGVMSYGSLKDSTLMNLWNHPVMNTYRRSLLEKNRNLPLCRDCDCYTGAYSFNVDPVSGRSVSKKFLERMYVQGMSKQKPPL